MLPPAGSTAPSDDDRQGWRRAVWFILAVLAARIAYLFLFNTWELVADEAQYWEWSRRPDWSYYTKGPGVAWVIWLSTHLLGTSEASVRLPSAIATALMTLVGVRLAFDITRGSGRAAMNTAIALTLAPAYFALGQILYTDTFWTTGWLIATWLVFRATRPDALSLRRLSFWTAAGFVIGLTCLFKYTALLFIPGVALFLFVARRDVRWDRTTAFGVVCAVSALLLGGSPIVIWNATRGWPTVSHQVGRVRLPGGDESVDWSWSPQWFLSFAGAQLALMGVVGIVLIVLAMIHERRRRDEDVSRRVGTALLISIAAPTLLFYLGLSLLRQVQGNWAVAAYSTLLVLVGICVTEAMALHREVVARWLALPEPRPRAGRLTRRPETPFQVMWHWYIGAGIVVGLIILLGPRLLSLPPLAKVETVRRANARISGARQHALEIAAVADANRLPDGRLPLLIANRYQEAGLLAFYMPGHPLVYCAASHLGSRRNAYDFFHDTNLADPKLHGQRALLIGGTEGDWKQAIRYRSLEHAESAEKVLVLDGYGGLAEDGNR